MLIAIVAISLVALSYTPTRGAITSAVFMVAPSVWKIEDSVSSYLGTLSVNFRAKDVLYSENVILREEISRMQIQVLDRNLLKEKTDSLLETLGRKDGDNRIVANVLVGPKFLYGTLVVDVGSDAGVSVGNLVVYSGSGVIGEVVEVGKSSSKVTLYSSIGKEYSVFVGSNSIPSTARSRGMGNFEATVPVGSNISVGDSVTSADGKLIFGTISLVEEIQTEPIERLFFRLPFNTALIRTVEIIR